jgi:hypothetical protein
LALASQSVGLLVSQLPVIRSVLSSRLPPKHHVLLHSLDRVSKDCQEHQREIFAKLVAIMDELIKYMRERIESMPWATDTNALNTEQQQHQLTAQPVSGVPVAIPVAVPAVPLLSAEESCRVDEPVRMLMKQTCSLHRALTDLLQAEQRDGVFRDISHLFVRHVRELSAHIDRSRPLVATKLATNIGHMASRLATCTGVDENSIQQLTTMAQI